MTLAVTLAAILAVILILGVAAKLALPGYLRDKIEQQTEQATGRRLRIQQLSISPFTLELHIDGITLFEADRATPAFSADSAQLQLSLASLLHAAPVIHEIRLTRPHLHLLRTGSPGHESSNFSDILARLAAQNAAHPTNAAPLRYSVSNIQLQNGEINLDDHIAEQQLAVTELNINLPFISNFPNAVTTWVEPGMAGKLNGSPFALKGRSTPFLGSHDTTLAINLNQLDVTRFIVFLPTPLPYRITSALLSTKLNLHFISQKNTPEISLNGTIDLTAPDLRDQHDHPLFKAHAIRAAIHNMNLLTGDLALNQLELDQPQVWAGLDRQGSLNWLPAQTGNRSSSHPVSTGTPPNTTTPDALPPTTATRPLFSLEQLDVTQATVHWSDAANATPTMQLDIPDISIKASHISSSAANAPAHISVVTGTPGHEYWRFDGTVNPATTDLAGKLEGTALSLATCQPYINRYLSATVSGTLGFATQLTMQAGEVTLSEFSGVLETLRVQAKAREYGEFSAKKIALDRLTLNTGNKQVQLDGLQFGGASADVLRDKDGTFNFRHFLSSSAPAIAASTSTSTSTLPQAQQAQAAPLPRHTAPAVPSTHHAAGTDWQILLKNLTISNGAVQYRDQSVLPAVNIRADAINASMDAVSGTLDKPVNLHFSTRLNKSGKLALQGSVAAQAAQLSVDALNLPVASLQPYFTDTINVTLTSGNISTRGKLNWKAPAGVTYQGKVQLTDFRILNKDTSDDFMAWKRVDITGMNLDLSGTQPRITLGSIGLNDFYARAILSEQGKLNLQNIIAETPPPAMPASGATGHNNSSNSNGNASSNSATSPATVPNANAPIISIGQILVNGGSINYTDNFIKPHYNVRMTGLQGNIGAISSSLPQPATIKLNGSIDGDAPVAISGALNPLFSPMFLDIKTSATGIELPRLTSYSAKYAGYPIEKGKLSMDVQYHVENNALTAQNTLMIDQLTFGNQVESPSATHLPVQLLVALLKDRNGQINLNLPISGTINDPEFSLGGLILRVVINLLGRVITSPFSLLGQAFSGGEELAYVEFPSGSAKLSDAARTKLDTIIKAMDQRPALKLDMTGYADEKVDAGGLRAALLNRSILNTLGASGGEDNATPPAATDRAKAIEQLYAAAKMDKPRSMLGFAKSLPTNEMEQRLLAHMQINTDDLQGLAQRRTGTVRRYLEQNGHIDSARLFSIAPKLSGNDIKGAGTISRVDFALKM